MADKKRDPAGVGKCCLDSAGTAEAAQFWRYLGLYIRIISL